MRFGRIVIVVTVTHFAVYECYTVRAETVYFNGTRSGIKLFENTFFPGGGEGG